MQKSFFGSSTGTTGGLFGASSTGTGAAPAATTTAFNFGGQSTAQPAAAAATGSSFGSSFFNKPAATASPFGQTQPQQQQPAAAATSSPFSFGGATSQPATTTTSTGFGGFGQPQQQQQTATGATSGFSGFGAATQPAAGTSLFGGATTTTTPQKPTFSFAAASTTTPQQQQQTTFNFSSGATTASGGGSFGFGARPTLTLGQTQAPATAAAQPAASVNIDDALMNTLVNPQVYNDERDQILAKWNQLQVAYGTGKVFFQNSSIDVKEDNRFTKFKTIGYSCKASNKNEDGLICLIIKQKEDFVKTNQKSIVECLHKIFGSNPNLTVVIDSIKAQMEDKTEVVFFINERVSPQNDQTKRVLSTLIFAHLSKQEPPAAISTLKTTLTVKQQLEQISVVHFYPLIGFTDEQIKSYLDTAPAGLNPLLWEQAKKNNPNPKKLLPIQIVGFQEINKRFKLQQQENEAQKANLAKIAGSIETINAKNRLLKAKIDQFKARNENLEQRVLKVFINYEIRRKVGFPLQENESYLLGVLTAFQNDLNSPINKEILRQKFTEFIDVIKSMEQSSSRKASLANRLNVSTVDSPGGGGGATGKQVLFDPNNLGEVYKTLKEEQKAVKSLIEIVNKNLADLGLIKNDLIIK